MEEISPDSEFLVDMNAEGPGLTPFAVAHIATNLVPLADDHLSGASRINIVGYDGASVSQENYRWTADLVKWVNLGNHVQYLLLNPSDEVIARLRQEAEKLQDAAGSLRVIVPDSKKALKPADSRLLERWETFHFIAFNNPKQLWVEKHHAAGSTANDCTYFSPAAAEKSALWDLLSQQFEYVAKEYGQPVISAGKDPDAAEAERELVELA